MAFDISYFNISPEDLPPGWSIGRLDTLVQFNPEQISSGYPHNQIAYLDIANVAQGVVGSPIFLPLSSAPSRAKRIVRLHDCILSTVRPGNRAYAFLQEVPENLVVSTGFAVLRTKPGKADPLFIYYLATSDPIINYLASIAEEKTAYPSVNPVDIAECVVPIPPLPEQRTISHILGALDDKIELNRKMNETLEAMARAIFKSWFVDVDPIPGLSPHKEWQDSPLGKIPKGWRVENIGEVIELAYGKALKEDVRQGGHIPVYGSNGQVGWHNEKLVNGPGIVVGRKGNPGIVTWVPTDFYPIDTTFYVTPKGIITSMYYLYHVLRLQDLPSLGADSAVPGLNRNMAYMNKVLVPPPEIISDFDDQVKPLADKIDHNNSQSRTLASIRDALLPKLLSGEIRVKNAESFVGRNP